MTVFISQNGNLRDWLVRREGRVSTSSHRGLAEARAAALEHQPEVVAIRLARNTHQDGWSPEMAAVFPKAKQDPKDPSLYLWTLDQEDIAEMESDRVANEKAARRDERHLKGEK